MADIQLDTEGNPSTPSSGSAIILVNSTNKELTTVDDAGIIKTIRTLTNASTADVVANAADTYLTGSAITIPPGLVKVGSLIRWTFTMAKTGAGTATPTFIIRLGTAGTVSDTAQVTYTLSAQTAVIDTGWCEIILLVRVAGASGQIETGILFTHNLATTGLSISQVQVQQAIQTAINFTTTGLIFGVSCNPGASGVWTFSNVMAVGMNL